MSAPVRQDMRRSLGELSGGRECTKVSEESFSAQSAPSQLCVMPCASAVERDRRQADASCSLARRTAFVSCCNYSHSDAIV